MNREEVLQILRTHQQELKDFLCVVLCVFFQTGFLSHLLFRI